jgi:hypothetical protein
VQVLLKMMRQPMPASATVAGVQDQEKTACWLLRKWLLRLAYRLVDRYGDPKSIKLETARPFATLFLAEFSKDYLEVRPPMLPDSLLGHAKCSSTRLRIEKPLHGSV